MDAWQGALLWRAAEVLEFGLLCVAPAHKRGGLATHLIHHSEGVAKARGQKRMQCELLVPRDLEAHPHPAAGMYGRMTVSVSR